VFLNGILPSAAGISHERQPIAARKQSDLSAVVLAAAFLEAPSQLGSDHRKILFGDEAKRTTCLGCFRRAARRAAHQPTEVAAENFQGFVGNQIRRRVVCETVRHEMQRPCSVPLGGRKVRPFGPLPSRLDNQIEPSLHGNAHPYPAAKSLTLFILVQLVKSLLLIEPFSLLISIVCPDPGGGRRKME
jgi:hypothetical protein